MVASTLYLLSKASWRRASIRSPQSVAIVFVAAALSSFSAKTPSAAKVVESWKGSLSPKEVSAPVQPATERAEVVEAVPHDPADERSSGEHLPTFLAAKPVPAHLDGDEGRVPHGEVQNRVIEHDRVRLQAGAARWAL